MRILLATDLSPATTDAEELLRTMSLPAGSVIRVVQVLEHVHRSVTTAATAEVEAYFPGYVEGIHPSHSDERVFVDQGVALTADRHLDALAAVLRRPGVGVEHHAVIGSAVETIVEEAKSFGADLIVTGSRGRGALATTLLGSVSGGIIDAATCPVLVVHTEGVQKILLADDGSPSAQAAVSFLAACGLFTQATIEVLGVVDVPIPLGYGEVAGLAVDSFETTIAEISSATATRAAQTGAKLRSAGRAVTTNVREGRAAAEIVEEAESIRADLIVMGSRGHTGLSRWVLGSTTHRVLTHSPRSVLVVHAPATAQAGPPVSASGAKRH